MLVLLRFRRLKRVATQPGTGDLLDNTEQDGDDDSGLEGFPEHDEENWNGEHVRHDCFKGVVRTNDVRKGEFREKEGKGERPDVGGTGRGISLYNIHCFDTSGASAVIR